MMNTATASRAKNASRPRALRKITATAAVGALAAGLLIANEVTAVVAHANSPALTVTAAAPAEQLWGLDTQVTLSFLADGTEQQHVGAAVIFPAGVSLVDAGELSDPQIFPSGSILSGSIGDSAVTSCELLGLDLSVAEHAESRCTVPAGQQYAVFSEVPALAAQQEKSHTITFRADTAVHGLASEQSYRVNAYSTGSAAELIFPGTPQTDAEQAVLTLASSATATVVSTAAVVTQTAIEQTTGEETVNTANPSGQTISLNVQRSNHTDAAEALVSAYLPAGLEYLGSCGLATDQDSVAHKQAELLEDKFGSLELLSTGESCAQEVSIENVRGTIAPDGTFAAQEGGSEFTQVTWGYATLRQEAKVAAQGSSNSAEQAESATVQYRVGVATESTELEAITVTAVATGENNGVRWVETADVAVEPVHALFLTQATHSLTAPAERMLVAAADPVFPDVPHLKWEVKSEGNAFVGGATVTIRGPRQDQSPTWSGEYEVTDCQSIPCAEILGDMDPRPGSFWVSKLSRPTTTGYISAAVVDNKRYGIMQKESPNDWKWKNASTEFTDIPGRTNNINQAASNTWDPVTRGYDFKVLRVTQAAVLKWSVRDQAQPSGSFTGGATFKLQPRTGNAWGGNGTYYVTDCTVAPCHPESMDQDSAPGKFAVGKLRGISNNSPTFAEISNGTAYEIQPSGSIYEKSWVSSTTQWTRTPVATGSNSWGPALEYIFTTPFVVTTNKQARNICTSPAFKDSYYSLHWPSTGAMQVQRIGLDTSRAVPSIKNSTSEMNASYQLQTGQQRGNALGLTNTGVFYFTGQAANESNELRRNTSVYRYDPQSNAQPYPVFNLDLLSPLTGTIVSGDATIYQGYEEFYFAYYSDYVREIRNASGGLIRTETDIRFHLYRYSHGNGARTGEVRHIDVPKPASFGSEMNGDFTFDADNNLHFIISDASQNVVSGSVPAAEFETVESAHTLPDVTRIDASDRTVGTVANGKINGVTFTKSGHAIIQQTDRDRNSVITMPQFSSQTGAYEFSSFDMSDLAGCDEPPTVTVQKQLIGDRVHPGDQFTLKAERRTAGDSAVLEQLASVTTKGNTSGLQVEKIGPAVITQSGVFTASETLVNEDPAAPRSTYNSSWACFLGDSETPFRKSTGNTQQTLSFNMSEVAGTGKNVVCTFYNEGLAPKLVTNKQSFPASGATVTAGQTIQYRLDFSNMGATLPAVVNHTDHLGDVRDDIVIDRSSIRYSNGGDSYPSTRNPQGVSAEFVDENLKISGSVPVNQQRTVWFTGTVKANTSERGNDSLLQPYVVNNYLTPAGEEVPSVCEAGNQNCTTHPIRAWTVSKSSQPQDGAMLHTGGNIYYTLDVAKVGAQDTEITGIQITDDMSEVMAVAHMDVNAPNYGGQFSFDVKTYRADGTVARSFANDPANAWDDGRAFEQKQLYPTFVNQAAVIDQNNFSPSDPQWKWQTALPTFTLRAGEVRAEVMYIVKIKGAANPLDPTAVQVSQGTVSFPPALREEFENTIVATAQGIQPNDCWDAANLGEMCSVKHGIGDSFFNIQKNSTANAAGEFDPADGVQWNLRGAEFEIRDAATNSTQVDSASAQLCWSNYAPQKIGDVWHPGDPTGQRAANATLDSGEHSQTYQALLAYNAQQQMLGLAPAPMCGLMYEITEETTDKLGQSLGAWHVRDLKPGNYQLVETRAPVGHEIMSEGIEFVVHAGPGNELDLIDNSAGGNAAAYLERCTAPNNLPSNGTLACVMQTGWLMQVYDAKLPALPAAGGIWLRWVSFGGISLLALVAAAAVWNRKRSKSELTVG